MQTSWISESEYKFNWLSKRWYILTGSQSDDVWEIRPEYQNYDKAINRSY